MRLAILGIRGVPAAHGGFETFAEHLSLYLSERGWDVVVYCHEEGRGEMHEDTWQGITRRIIPVKSGGALGTIIFDWLSVLHAARHERLILTLGYNTAIFSLAYKVHGNVNVINMDGIEWKREKWSFMERAWLRLNERFADWLGDCLVADHPEIARHLAAFAPAEKIVTIPYGANEVDNADESALDDIGVHAGHFLVVIARAEPENSILEIVRAFSRKARQVKLVVLGKYEPDRNPYHRSVMDAASEEVIFPGAVYDSRIVKALRYFARLYIHGHKVGGTNPSLVEALGAGCAVLAHDNRFTRWVAREGAHYFASEDECAAELDKLLVDDVEIGRMQCASRERFAEAFRWPHILGQYEQLLSQMRPGDRKARLG